MKNAILDFEKIKLESFINIIEPDGSFLATDSKVIEKHLIENKPNWLSITVYNGRSQSTFVIDNQTAFATPFTPQEDTFYLFRNDLNYTPLMAKLIKIDNEDFICEISNGKGSLTLDTFSICEPIIF